MQNKPSRIRGRLNSVQVHCFGRVFDGLCEMVGWGWLSKMVGEISSLILEFLSYPLKRILGSIASNYEKPLTKNSSVFRHSLHRVMIVRELAKEPREYTTNTINDEREWDVKRC